MISTPKILLSIDPGKKTGVATFNISATVDPILTWSEEMDIETFQDTTADYLARGLDLEVVIEEFKITSQTGKLSDAPWSLEHIGLVRYLCRTHSVPLTFQSPARAKNFVPNDRLKALEMWHKGGGGHALDAIRHGVLYLVENHNWRPESLLD